LNLRPVFTGGSNIEHADNQEIIDGFLGAFDQWFMKGRQILDPIYYLLGRRLFNIGVINGSDYDMGCPFQHNCADVSFDLEPNGDIYVCLDMADSGQFVLGNALKGTFDQFLWRTIRQRSLKLNRDCLSCNYYRECQGGCMSEAIYQGNGIYGKTNYCGIWKSLFRKMDQAVVNENPNALKSWYLGISH
jgi:radical SAM protein with 4Fe4S-binding SPASM domain